MCLYLSITRSPLRWWTTVIEPNVHSDRTDQRIITILYYYNILNNNVYTLLRWEYIVYNTYTTRLVRIPNL